MVQEVTCDTGSDILTELEGWHITGLKRRIFISEEEACTLSCFKDPKQHLDTVKLLLSCRQMNPASASEPSQAEALQAQCSVPGRSRQLHTEPGDSSPDKAPRASSPKPKPWETQPRKEWGSARCSLTPPHVSDIQAVHEDESSWDTTTVSCKGSLHREEMYTFPRDSSTLTKSRGKKHLCQVTKKDQTSPRFV